MVQADSTGAESPMPLADFIDIGVFKGKAGEEAPLYMNRVKMTQDHQRFTITVDERPTRAGIDPDNKLIDRDADDNMTDVANR
jgi:ABC-2 type transport system permease protein